MKTLSLLFVLLCHGGGIGATPPDTLGFRLLESNHMVIEVVLNDMDTVDLMVHTAIQGVALKQGNSLRFPHVVWNDSRTAESWGGRSSMRYSTGNKLTASSTSLFDIDINEDKDGPKGTDGKIGLSVFQNWTVELNYDEQIIVLHDTTPANNWRMYISHVMEPHPAFITIDGEIAHRPKHIQTGFAESFLLHSGYGGTILLSDSLIRKHPILDSIPKTGEQMLKDSYGNDVKVVKRRIPEMNLALARFVDVPAGTFPGVIGGQAVSIIGADIIKRFNWFIDFEGAQIYFIPNSLYEAPFAKG